MSITTTSPTSITRSDTSWCGLAPLGPEPTITNAASACPSSTIAAAMSAAACASVRPALRNSAIRACTRSIAAPAARSSRTSAASLRIRSSRSTGPARLAFASGSASCTPKTCTAGIVSATAIRVGPAREVADQQVGVLAVLPGDDLDAEVVEAEVREPGRLHAGHDERGRRPVARRGHDEAGEPLVGGRVGADQVAQVGAGGDEQQLDVEVGGDLARPADAVGALVGQPGCHAPKGIRASSAP